MASASSAALEEEANFPMGYRFKPTDEEIAAFYLNGFPSPIPLAKAVHEIVHFDACEPWALKDSYSLQRVDRCYFLSHRNCGRHPKDKDKDKHGVWKPTGKEIQILDASGDHVCALRKPYKYFRIVNDKAIESNWMMSEYRIAEPGHRDKKLKMEFQRVLCVIEEKKKKKPEDQDCANQMLSQQANQQDRGDQPLMLQNATGDTFPNLDLGQFYSVDGVLIRLLTIVDEPQPQPSLTAGMNHHLPYPFSSMPLSGYLNQWMEDESTIEMSAEGCYQRDGGDRPSTLQDVVAASQLDSFPSTDLQQFSNLEGYYQRHGGDEPNALQDVVAASQLDLFPFTDFQQFSNLDSYDDYLLYNMREPEPQPSLTTRMNHDQASTSSTMPVYEDISPSMDHWIEEHMSSPSQVLWGAGSTRAYVNIEQLPRLMGAEEGRDMQLSRLEEDSLPIGVRFFPTDEEIILYFLMKQPCRQPLVIHEVNVYEYDPWTLQMGSVGFF